MGFPGGSDGKVSACNAGDPGLIPGSGRSLGEQMAIYSSTLAWKIPWMEEPDRLQSMGCKELDTSEGISLEGMMLKLKLQYLGHLMRRIDSLEKTLMLGGIGGRRTRGRQEDEMVGWHH